MVKRTNLPRRGTTREVGGMISAKRRKNTVSESRMEIERLTWSTNIGQYRYFTIDNSFKYLAGIEMKPLEVNGPRPDLLDKFLVRGFENISNILDLTISPFPRCQREDRIPGW